MRNEEKLTHSQKKRRNRKKVSVSCQSFLVIKGYITPATVDEKYDVTLQTHSKRRENEPHILNIYVEKKYSDHMMTNKMRKITI